MKIPIQIRYFGAFVAPPLIVSATTAAVYISGDIAASSPHMKPMFIIALVLGLASLLTLEFENLLARVLAGFVYIVPCWFIQFVAAFLTGCAFGDCL